MSDSRASEGKARCCICDQAAGTKTLLCETCSAAALRVSDLVPEQIVMSAQGDCDACLVDAWGRIYGLAATTLIGRDPEGHSIAIHQASISRRHVTLEQEAGGGFALTDLASTNGTQVGDRMVDSKTALVSGDRVFVGSVGFYYLCPRPRLPSAAVEFSTLRPLVSRNTAEVYKTAEETALNDLESVPIEVIEATGGGGGFIEIAGTQIQISMIQLELMKLLLKRMDRDRARPAAVRGYLHSSEILAEVSWDTAHPSDNHVKQLVRRLRRSLARSGRNDLVESQQGLGYRLSVRPS